MSGKIYNSKEFFHDTFEIINIIYDGWGNIYSIGNQINEKLGCNIREMVPEEFIISLRDIKKYGNTNIDKIIPKEYNHEDTLILKEPGIHILLASSTNPLARDFCVWLFSKVFPSIRGNPYNTVFY